MSAIPADILEIATAIVDRIAKQHFLKGDCVADVAQAILSERQRQAEVMEEVRKAADLVVNNPAFFTTTYEERPYATITFDNAEAAHRFNDGLIGLRALLSKLGGE